MGHSQTTFTAMGEGVHEIRCRYFLENGSICLWHFWVALGQNSLFLVGKLQNLYDSEKENYPRKIILVCWEGYFIISSLKRTIHSKKRDYILISMEYVEPLVIGKSGNLFWEKFTTPWIFLDYYMQNIYLCDNVTKKI